MKKLILLLLLIPIVSFGQIVPAECPCFNGRDCMFNPCGTQPVQSVPILKPAPYVPVQTQNTEQNVQVNNEVKTEVKTNTVVQRPLVLSEEKTNIKTPLTADLSIYTHVLIVNVTNIYGQMNKTVAQDLEKMLSLTIFKVMNPYKVHKRAKKEPSFLKTVKNESYLYLYLNRSRGRGDDVNSTFIIRDSKNKIVYNATHINTGLNEILAPLIDY